MSVKFWAGKYFYMSIGPKILSLQLQIMPFKLCLEQETLRAATKLTFPIG